MNIVHEEKKYECPTPELKPVYLGKIIGKTINIKIIIDTDTGILKVYHPFKSSYYYEIDLGSSLTNGSYFSFRTNSLSVVIDDFKVTAY
jgi:hypothetical protein